MLRPLSQHSPRRRKMGFLNWLSSLNVPLDGLFLFALSFWSCRFIAVLTLPDMRGEILEVGYLFQRYNSSYGISVRLYWLQLFRFLLLYSLNSSLALTWRVGLTQIGVWSSVLDKGSDNDWYRINNWVEFALARFNFLKRSWKTSAEISEDQLQSDGREYQENLS